MANETTKPSMLTSNRWKAVLAGLVGVVVVYLCKAVLNMDEATANQISTLIVGLISVYVIGRSVSDLKSPAPTIEQLSDLARKGLPQ